MGRQIESEEVKCLREISERLTSPHDIRSTFRLLKHSSVQADPDASYTKLTSLPSALIWYQVALLGMESK